MAATGSLCNTCQHKFSNNCVNCGGYGSGPVAKLCTSCSYSSGCIKCGGYSSGATARLCTSCGYKFSNKCFKCGNYAG